MRNWFDASEDIDSDRLSLNDKLGDVLFNAEVQKLIKNHAGVTLDSPLLKPIGMLPLKPVATIAGKMGKGNYVTLINQFLQTIEKN